MNGGPIKQREWRKNRSIRSQLRNWGLLVATVPLLVFGLSVAILSLRSQYVQNLSEQTVYARLVAARARDWLLDVEGVVLTSLRVAGFETADTAARRSILNTLLASHESIEELAFVDPHGDEELRASRTRAYTAQDLRHRGTDILFRTASEQSRAYYSDLRFSAITGEPLVEMGLPIIDRRAGTVTGVVTVEVRAQFIWELLRDSSLNPSTEVYLLDSTGRLFAHPNPSVVLAGTTVPQPLQTGVGSALQPHQALIAVEPFEVRNRSFLLVVERPLAHALDIFFATVMLIGPLLLITIAIALWLALRSALTITKPLSAIADIAQEIRDRNHYNLSALSDISQTSWKETATLAATISSMVEQLEEKIAQIRNSLAEREVLLREVHHRVKNNLQIIISLTNIQGQAMHDDRDAETFASLKGRIYSMAMVHDQLYQSATLTSISLDSYLQSLVSHLSGLYSEAQCALEITTDLEPVEIALEQAVSFGMLAGEVISNSMKHAFSGRDRGRIHVVLRPERSGSSDGVIVLFEVHDDGVGLAEPQSDPPADPTAEPADEKRPGFGMLLIQELSRQLDASAEFDQPPGGGTRFRLRCRITL